MSISKNEIIDTISNMSVLEIMELVELIEKKFNISSSTNLIEDNKSKQYDISTEEKKEKTEYDIIMSSFGPNKISVIKIIREISSLGLKEAKDLVESVPSTIKSGITQQEANDIKKKLEDAGACIEIK